MSRILLNLIYCTQILNVCVCEIFKIVEKSLKNGTINNLLI